MPLNRIILHLLGGLIAAILIFGISGCTKTRAESTATDKGRQAETATDNKTPAVEVLSLTNPIYPGGDIILIARTLPSASCTLDLGYKPSADEQKMLTKKADKKGLITWSWKLNPNVKLGTYLLRITSVAPDGSKSVSQPEPLLVKSESECNT